MGFLLMAFWCECSCAPKVRQLEFFRCSPTVRCGVIVCVGCKMPPGLPRHSATTNSTHHSLQWQTQDSRVGMLHLVLNHSGSGARARFLGHAQGNERKLKTHRKKCTNFFGGSLQWFDCTRARYWKSRSWNHLSWFISCSEKEPRQAREGCETECLQFFCHNRLVNSFLLIPAFWNRHRCMWLVIEPVNTKLLLFLAPRVLVDSQMTCTQDNQKSSCWGKQFYQKCVETQTSSAASEIICNQNHFYVSVHTKFTIDVTRALDHILKHRRILKHSIASFAAHTAFVETRTIYDECCTYSYALRGWVRRLVGTNNHHWLPETCFSFPVQLFPFPLLQNQRAKSELETRMWTVIVFQFCSARFELSQYKLSHNFWKEEWDSLPSTGFRGPDKGIVRKINMASSFKAALWIAWDICMAFRKRAPGFLREDTSKLLWLRFAAKQLL